MDINSIPYLMLYECWHTAAPPAPPAPAPAPAAAAATTATVERTLSVIPSKLYNSYYRFEILKLYNSYYTLL